MKFADEVFATLDAAHGELASVSGRLMAHEAFPAIMREWFVSLFHIIRATTPLLTLAAQTRPDSPAPWEVTLQAFYRHKLEEEAGHDTMLAKDLEHLGHTPEAIAAGLGLPSAAITAMVGSQYYLIEYVHPAAYLGYMGALEGYQGSAEQVEELARRSGLPSKAFSTHRLHAQADIWHRDELEQMLEEVPPGPVRQAIIANGVRTVGFHRMALLELGAKHHALT